MPKIRYKRIKFNLNYKISIFKDRTLTEFVLIIRNRIIITINLQKLLSDLPA